MSKYVWTAVNPRKVEAIADGRALEESRALVAVDGLPEAALKDAALAEALVLLAGLRYLTFSTTFDPISLVAGVGTDGTIINATGCALGDLAIASFSLDLNGLILTAWVNGTDTIRFHFHNGTGGTIDLGSGTLKVRVFK